MSPIDPHEEPWLRDALRSLLVDEPPMPPAAVVDDVRRGALAVAVVKRRRTATLAVAAAVLAVAVPVGLLLRAAPNASAPPATSITSAPKVTGVSQQWLDRISPAVTASTAGWVVDWPASTVTGSVADGLTLDLTLVPATVTGGSRSVVTLPTPPYPQTATVRLELLPAGKSPGAALASCPAATCPRDLPDRKFPTYLDVVAKAGNGTAFPAGTAIVDRSYDAGRFVELVSLPPVSTGSGASDAPAGAVLPYPFAGAFLDAIGEPMSATSPSPTPSASPGTSHGVRFVPDDRWETAVVATFPMSFTPTAHPVLGSSTYTLAGRVVDNAVGSSGRVDLQLEGQDGVGPLAFGPCDS